MIPREETWLIFITCTLLLVVEVKLQSGRSYDTNEWIPVTPSSLQTSSSEIVEQKTAGDRVLSLDAPAQNFFPNEEYEYKKQNPHQVPPFLREQSVKNGAEHPKPRKLKHPSDYKFETPPPPPAKNQPQINYYNGQNLSPYVFEQPSPPRIPKPIAEQGQQNYYVPIQQLPKQRPITHNNVATPNVNPQVPAPNAPNLYEQYQLPFNSSFYQSLNPASLNNEFYQAISNGNQSIQQNLQTRVPQQSLPLIGNPAAVPKPAIEQESVQLVYVPVENLQPGHSANQNTRNVYQKVKIPKQETIPFNTVPQASQIINFQPLDQPRQEKLVYNPYLQQRPELSYQQVEAPRQEKLVATQDYLESKQHRLENIQQDFIQQALQAHKFQKQLQDDINPLNQDPITTTPRPNRKPHQPPLAVFMESQKKAEISDVLSILRGAKTISVQDTVTPDSPKIFVGPSNLDSPEGYTKFPLPYLNNINGNRIERKIDQLPFFVAPVAYKTPPGYSKISLPSPHVGSVVVSVPFTSTTTPQPILLHQNQVNPYTFSSLGYSPLDPPTVSKPVQNFLGNYETSDPGRTRYQSTSAPHVTESPLILPVRDIFDSQFAPPQPEVYYTQSNSQETYRDSVPALDIYRPQLPEENRYSSSQENTRDTSRAVRPKEASHENSQLPNINPLELAINEFELHQINDQFNQPNKKVKHSTTRRPQNRNNYEDNHTVSSTRSPVSRGRQPSENNPTTERTAPRGRVRGRGRGSSSRTVTTTTTTTPQPVESDRYTTREEFVAREPTRGSSTKNYGSFSAEAETEAPRRVTTPFDSNPYLPEQSFENRRPEPDFGSPVQTRRGEDYKDRRPQSDFENSRSQTVVGEEFEQSRPETVFQTNPSTIQLEDTRPQTQFDRTRSQSDGKRRHHTVLESNRSPTQLENKLPQNQFDHTRSQAVEVESPRTRVTSLDVEKPQDIQQSSQFYPKNTEIENIPTSVYSLGQPQTYDSTAFDFDSSKNTEEPNRPFYENDNNQNIKADISNTARPALEDTRPIHSHRFSPDVISYENREPNQQLRPQEIPKYQEYESDVNNEPDVKQAFQSGTYQRPATKIISQVLKDQRPRQESIEDSSGFLENLYQPNFDETYLTLQDQAVRSLLVPNLLAPSTRQQLPSTVRNEEIISSTEAIIELPSSTEAETTTTTRATRTRGRGRARPGTTSATVTSAPRRTTGRKRPVSRTSTERIASSTEYASREDTEKSSSITKHFRTGGRPVHTEISDRISTTENDIRAFKEPTPEGGFEAVNNRQPPQSYMQFEQAIDEQQIITINPNLNQETEVKDYHQVYSLQPQTTTEKQQIVLEYENTRSRVTPVVDIQVTHTIPEEHQRNPDVITKPTEDEQFVRYNKASIRSGGVLHNNKPVVTTREPTTKTRGRTRGRSRFATTTKTTSRPVTRISPSTTLRTTTQEEEEQEAYGFIRQPAYSQKSIQALSPIQTSPRSDEPAVHFVGEIRPKYSPRKTTSQPIEELEAVETPRPRIRARTRAPLRKTTSNYRQSDNDVNSSKRTEQVTRRSGTARGKVRGSSHYRAAENQKRESDEEDVANQNYPVNFLQKLDTPTSKVTNTPFQITIDPMEQESNDQTPYASISRPKFVPKPDGWSDPNGLSADDKPTSIKPAEITSSEQADVTSSTNEPQALPIVQTTQNSDELFTQFADAEVSNVMSNLEQMETLPSDQTFTALEPSEEPISEKKNRRKGAWKLVRHRVVDPLEVSESQNYQSVFNVFDSIQKVDPYTKSDLNQDKFNTDTNSYNKDDLSSNDFKEDINSFHVDNFESQNYANQKDIEEVVTVVTENDSANPEFFTETNDELLSTTPSTFKTQENIFDTIYEMFGIFKKPEEKKNITITTPSESSENESPTTLVNPVFPEEITEESSTISIEKIVGNPVINQTEENSNDKMGTTERISTTTADVQSLTKPYEVEPWEMKAVKTSTSTEVSHETEICYKGRCVKSKEKKKYK